MSDRLDDARERLQKWLTYMAPDINAHPLEALKNIYKATDDGLLLWDQFCIDLAIVLRECA